MANWVVLFIGGDLGVDVLVVGSFGSFDAAFTYIVSTGSPWNYQACPVYGPAIPPPMGHLAAIGVPVGSWIAIASAINPSGGVSPVGYGTFASKSAALAWASTQGNPAGYSFGNVTAAPA